MPRKAKRPCRYPGCPNVCEGVYCDEHKQFFARETATSRGYNSEWQKVRKRYLQLHPLCVKCMERGVLTPATVVDHIIPHRGNKELFWDENNYQALCARCHNEKTGHGL